MAKKTTLDINKDLSEAAILPLEVALFAPGDRVCVAVSGGADSTALLRCLLERRDELGIVLSVLHVEHGLRGQASVDDAAFVCGLAEQYGLPCDVVRVNTPQRMTEQKESMETAARALRYQVFRDILAAGKADKVATAHTLDDQAETVLMKLLRGAWTEGLSGIHPERHMESNTGWRDQNGRASARICVRPFLAVQRKQIEGYLRAIGQPWRQDASNDSLEHMRNRIRHELLPILRGFNPQIDSILAHMADNARAEEQHWQAELDRVLPLLLLPGRSTRGGGRSVSTSIGSPELAIEIARLRELDPALLRRVLRAAAERAGAILDFNATERLLSWVRPSAHGSGNRMRLELAGGVSVERSARELRFRQSSATRFAEASTYELPVPGTVDAPAFHARFTATWPENLAAEGADIQTTCAQIRVWRAGDRVELEHSRGPKKVKEILNRMRISAEDRAAWPVVTWRGNIIWMRGVILANDANRDRSTDSSPGAWLPTPAISEVRNLR
ncbi:MAG TPA: tRNA lysidine(34) synthetase TilS [Acidobacteriaceae bacterium]|nr:tRNA lysidine(34) synthetase TilS [Acidobacteriaceae bacterium]